MSSHLKYIYYFTDTTVISFLSSYSSGRHSVAHRSSLDLMKDAMRMNGYHATLKGHGTVLCIGLNQVLRSLPHPL